MQRPTWDEYFMTLAVVASARSTCQRAHVGAIFVRDNRVVSTGYNGSPRGLPHCLDEGCLQDEPGGSCKRTIHAETNAVAWAARHGVPLAETTVYVSHYTPCLACSYLLIQVGVREIVYRNEYHDRRSLDILEQAGITMRKFDGELVDPEEVLTWMPPESVLK